MKDYPNIPTLGERTPQLFWNDPHISKQMLKAHLAFDNDLASRKKETIVNSVEFIIRTLNLTPGMKILDLGCGPGLYTEEFSQRGFDVTGMDYSERSIAYATNSALEKNLSLHYLYQNYLELDFENTFDVILLIYFDYGALTDSERSVLEPKISKALKNGGHFIFDSYSSAYFQTLKPSLEKKEFKDGGFWKEEAYEETKERILYPEAKTVLTRYTIHSAGDEEKTYHIWDRAFSVKELETRFNKQNLKLLYSFSDLTGAKDKQETLGLFFQKHS